MITGMIFIGGIIVGIWFGYDIGEKEGYKFGFNAGKRSVD